MNWRVIQADALASLKGMTSGSCGCVITDPPEPVDDGIRDYNAEALVECLRVSDGPVVWLGVQIADGRYSHAPLSPVPDLIAHWAVTLHDEIIGIVPVYCWRVGRRAAVQLAKCDNLLYGDMRERAPTPKHMGEKPLTLALGLMKHFAKGSVLDPFCGTGTFGAAAVLRGHDYLGIDSELAWVEMAREKIARVESDGLVLTQEVNA